MAAIRGRRRDRTAVPLITKYILFFWNFICEIGGLALMIACSYILYIKHKVVRDYLDFFLDPSCVFCLIGASAAFIAFFGCCGSLRENTIMLRIFNIFMGLMLLAELVLIILVFVFYYVPDVQQKIKLFPEDDFHKAIVKYRDDEDMQNLIDEFQQLLGCCGVSNNDEGYKDWEANMYFNCSKSNPSPERCSVPPSCCRLQAGQTINILCGQGVQLIEDGIVVDGDTSKIFTAGCLKALGDWIKDNSLVIGGALLGILIPQLVLVCLVRNLRDGIKTQKMKWRMNASARQEGIHHM